MPVQLVVLDRDGVINRDSPEFVKCAAEWQALDGSLEAIGLLCRAGFTVAIASNQSGIGRGLFDRRALQGMHRKLRRQAARHQGIVDRIVVCPHRPRAGCDCRKPRPGMLRKLASHYGVSLAGVPVVGDSLRDIEAAQAVGAQPVLVRTGNGRATETALQARGQAVETHDDLLAFARAVTASRTLAEG